MRAHISLNVSNIEKSVEFYQKIFGEKPQKQNLSYAKFDLEFPALNFALQVANTDELSRVGHLGIEIDSIHSLNLWRERLQRAGIITRDELGTNCCFALQDKIWITDPDQNRWEIFLVKQQLPVNSSARPNCCG